jgi:hypothetical protein
MEHFQTLIRELLTMGYTQQQLGAAVGKSQAWVAAVLAGEFKDLKWVDGQAVIALHAVKVKAAKAAA